MNANDAFPSTYLKANDLKGQRVPVVIESASMEDLGFDGNTTEKLVVHFQGKERGLVLNRTNCNSIIEIAKTADTDEWPGVRIVLYQDKTDFQGRRVDCIRIDAPPAAQGNDLTDEIPF